MREKINQVETNCKLWEALLMVSWKYDKTLQKASKSAGNFKLMATSLKNSETDLEYDIPHKDITDSTVQKPSKRAFLKRFFDFRHPPPHHFRDAFKNCNAPIVQA